MSEDNLPTVKIVSDGPRQFDVKVFVNGAELKDGVESAEYRVAYNEDPVVTLRLPDVALDVEGRLRLPVEQLRALAEAEGFELLRKTDRPFSLPVTVTERAKGRDVKTWLRVAPDGRMEIGDVVYGDRLVPFEPGRMLRVTLHDLSAEDFATQAHETAEGDTTCGFENLDKASKFYEGSEDRSSSGPTFTISQPFGVPDTHFAMRGTHGDGFADEAKATLDEADEFHQRTTAMVTELRRMRELLERMYDRMDTPPRGD